MGRCIVIDVIARLSLGYEVSLRRYYLETMKVDRRMVLRLMGLKCMSVLADSSEIVIESNQSTQSLHASA